MIPSPRLTWNFSRDTKAPERAAIVLIHNFGGSEDNLGRHIGLLNDLGWDVVTFDLSWHKNGPRRIFFKKLRDAWSEEIEVALKEVLAKRKVVIFTFSGIGVCTIDAVSDLFEKENSNILSLIFDSGPFDEYERCVLNMLKYYYGLKNFFFRTAVTFVMTKAWANDHSERTQRGLQKILSLQPELPILSIQGVKDRIVPIAYIKSCFSWVKAHSSHYTEAVFEMGGHLTSYKEEPEKYKQTLSKFLFR